MTTHTQRTLAELRKRPTTLRCAIVEKWNKFAVRPDTFQAGVRQDLFGFVDILVLDSKQGFIGVQSTGNDFAGHLKKLMEERQKECVDWLKAGGKIELWAWRKVKVKRGGKAVRYEPRIKSLTFTDFYPPGHWCSGLA